MISLSDLTVIGVQDDGSDTGIVRSKSSQSDLAMVPFRQNHHQVQGLNPLGGGFQFSYSPDNPDASATGLGIAVSPENSTYTALTGVTVDWICNGRRAGVRWMLQYPPAHTGPLDAEPSDFDFVVDDVAYHVTGGILAYKQSSQAFLRDQGMFVVDDLPDGIHRCRVIIQPDTAAGGTTRYLTLYGFLAEKRLGYQAPSTRGRLNLPAALTAAQAPIGIISQNGNPVGLRGVKYHNSDTVTRVVTIQWQSVTIEQLVLAPAGQAGCSATWDLLGDTAIGDAGNYFASHAADVTGVVYWSPIGILA